ncbi:IreB family regulatory phosphoprotein [Fuchsiella alkaliacetigena]|uniref:IreB family regulatory phosphoprotein n=1 Tax=Fuchsiella alkaliacetigena TaxID=957042 RepID=UPI00200B802A|nr:IreB family regulatory phosphoprotein [Fuchsiella alkaliacetigena]MCK8825087.1 IreB family regulatory phosphoprotein [Fuchsiella alkaliacetigena]
MSRNDETMMFRVEQEERREVATVLAEVHKALAEKGYNPINQIVGYILSGDPAYITSHQDARSKIRKFERDELIEELVKSYLEKEELVDN